MIYMQLETDGLVGGIDEGDVFPMGKTAEPALHCVLYTCKSCKKKYTQHELKKGEVFICPDCGEGWFCVEFG